MAINIKSNNGKFIKIYYNVDDVFDHILAITNNPELAMDVQGWSDLASIGETYETDKFIAIVE